MSKTTRLFERFAPAKVNLALHITGQRADGYHLLDSLVVFPQIGDRLTATVSRGEDTCQHGLSFDVTGPEAPALSETDPADNLVIRAFEAYCQATAVPVPAMALSLEKNLPVASGIGGGSADAAAALHLARDITGTVLPAETLEGLALSLGADVPVCLASESTRMSGIGEELFPLPALPPMGIVLVNPGLPVSTPEIFKRLKERNNPPLPVLPRLFGDIQSLVAYLQSTRNDMQEIAETLCPAVSEVLQALAQRHETLLARMSGSGATCFALTRSGDQAGLETAIRSAFPAWWVASGQVG